MAAWFSFESATSVLAFAALGLLGAGYLAKGKRKHALRIAGWLAFGAYWPTQSASFFAIDDPINGYFTLLAPLFFGYLAYHEWLSRKWGEDPKALRWVTGTAVIAAATYFAIYRIPGMTDLTIGTVAHHSSWFLSTFFGVPSHVQVDPTAPVESRFHIFLDNDPSGSVYAVTIILACTAIQSIMIFVGAIACTEKAAPRRRWLALAYTAPPIYVLNLLRNAGIVYGYKIQGWSCCGMDSFEFMHSWVGKGGSLLALVLIALVVFRTLPEMHDNILDLFDLPKRRKPGFFQRPPAVAPATPAAEPAAQAPILEGK
ncbi:MAG TPA: archaeosortase A [Candidatus Thermoplasmatota archaeon]|jgi:archaeosortase A (PGF-CTERM-specific)|nr:archaeosortase A [Candidatus Thermoplasmatota archaeon]